VRDAEGQESTVVLRRGDTFVVLRGTETSLFASHVHSTTGRPLG
jgi:hypothetical protein